MSTVVVTGGAGFIGSHLCDALLADAHRVIAVDDLSTGQRANLFAAEASGERFGFVHTDVRSGAFAALLAETRPEFVMHLAAQSGVRPSVDDPVNDAGVNVVGSLAVLQACVAAGVGKVVYAASGGTLYGEPSELPVGEEQDAGAIPTSPYGISKKVVDHYLRFFNIHYGLDYTELALANVYGPRQDPQGEAGVVALFGRRMLEGAQPTIFGDGEQTRDFVYVGDVARAFVLAANAEPAQLLNIGTGTQTSVLDIYRLLADATGYAASPIHGQARPEELRHIALSAKRAEQALGWTPAVSLVEGLAATVEYLRDKNA
jgi:UDP-glucose 4-epimerase